MAKTTRKPAQSPTPAAEANPRAIIGDNMGPTLYDADYLIATLPVSQAALAENVGKLLATARDEIPLNIETEEQMAVVTRTVVALRDETKKVVAQHAIDKEPYLRGGQAVDNFYFGMRDRLKKAQDVVAARGNAFTLRKQAEERARLQREADERAAAARRAQQEADQKREEEEAERRRLERLRNPERIEEAEETIAEKAGERAQAEAVAGHAAMAADDAARATQAPAADLVRTRYDTGHMSTAKQVPYVEITDYDLLPLDKLRAYIPRDALERAVKAFARHTSHQESLPGAIIEMRTGTVYRG